MEKKLFTGFATGLILISSFSVTAATTFTVTVPGTSDPWLAGMPNGSTASIEDSAPDQSPVQVLGLSLIAGQYLTFGVTGSVNYVPGSSGNGPDGYPGWYVEHNLGISSGVENGISSLNAPVSSLLGIFLGVQQPDLSTAPLSLDFGSSDSLNYSSLAPELKQVFFIGDGLTDLSVSQQIIIPVGASRFYLGTMDGMGWWNNYGEFVVNITDTSSGNPVPEPATMLLFGAGIAGLAAVGRRKRS